jgi:hypothetical protein
MPVHSSPSAIVASQDPKALRIDTYAMFFEEHPLSVDTT